jgi:SAM-dependent methyltransferase
MHDSSERLNFWDSRSSLGFSAGSGDTNLKHLEIKVLDKSIGECKYVLDAGCGNGITLASLASSHADCHFFGFDYSEGMVDAAKTLLTDEKFLGRVSLCQASLLDTFPLCLNSLRLPVGGFDCVYTERSIINLDTFDQQIKAIHSLWSMVASGGRLILCEAFLDGLSEINLYRNTVGLESIDPPWHNRYLSISELPQLLPHDSGTLEIVEFSGTYYFVSRILHARQAMLQNSLPSYDSAINKLSLDLPALPLFGQSKLIIIQKK